MKIDTRPRHRNSGRPRENDARGFLQWLRGRGCLFLFCKDCDGKIEAAHLDFAGGKGIATKVADRFAVPMCSHHHRQQHAMGWETFMAARGVKKSTILSAAEQYWRQWPGRIAWERKQEIA